MYFYNGARQQYSVLYNGDREKERLLPLTARALDENRSAMKRLHIHQKRLFFSFSSNWKNVLVICFRACEENRNEIIIRKDVLTIQRLIAPSYNNTDYEHDEL